MAKKRTAPARGRGAGLRPPPIVARQARGAAGIPSFDLTPSRACLLVGFVAAAVVVLVFLAPEERLSRGYDWFQNWRYHKEFIRSTVLSEGTIPLWCPWTFSGLPFLANPQTMLFYPGTLLYVLLPAGAALPIDAIAHFVLAGLGMFLFCRVRGLLPWACLFAAIGYLACGFNLAHTTVGHVHYYAAVAWLPFVFVSVEKWVVTRWPAWIAAGAGVIALQFFAGALPVSWMSMVFGGLYGAARVAEEWWLARFIQRPAGPARIGPRHGLAAAISLAGVLAIFGIGLLIACGQILPTRELASLSLREGKGYEFAASGSLPPRDSLHLLAPSYLGKNLSWECYGYFGLSTLALALAAIIARRVGRGGWIFAGLACLALLMMFGDATPAFRLFYAIVPGLSIFRIHAREVLVLGFCLASVAAAALDSSLRETNDAERKRWRLGRVASGALVCGAAIVLTSVSNGAGSGGEIVWLLAAAASGIVVAMIGPRKSWSGPLLVGLLVVDLLSAERVVRERLTIRSSEPAAQEALARVLRADTGIYRFWFPREFFMSDQGYAERRSAIEGYENMILRGYQSYIHAMTGAPVKPDVITILTQSNFRHAPSPFPFKILNVKYAAMPKQGGGYTLQANPDPCGVAFLAERVEVLPAETIVERMRSPQFDPRATAFLEREAPGLPAQPAPSSSEGVGSVSVVKMGSNRIVLEAEARREALLLASEIDYPGWKAIVDGAEKPLLRADGILRSVVVPSGRHRVEFVFAPPSLAKGLALSALGLGVCGGLLVLGRLGARRGVGSGLSGAGASSAVGSKPA